MLSRSDKGIGSPESGVRNVGMSHVDAGSQTPVLYKSNELGRQKQEDPWGSMTASLARLVRYKSKRDPGFKNRKSGIFNPEGYFLF